MWNQGGQAEGGGGGGGEIVTWSAHVHTCTHMYTHLWWPTEGVCVEYGLYHDQRLSDVLAVQLVTIVSTLIRTVVKHLQELRPPQMKHELRREASMI